MCCVKDVLKTVGCVVLLSCASLPCEIAAGNELPKDRSYQSYVEFIENRVYYYEFTDGFESGSYGEVNGSLSVTETCNVGGKLVHDVPGFAEWSFQLYREGELSTLGYSILMGGAIVPYFDYRERLRESKDGKSEVVDINTPDISISYTNIDRLLGNYN